MICPACTGTGMESSDPEDASACLDCNGSGVLPDPDEVIEWPEEAFDDKYVPPPDE